MKRLKTVYIDDNEIINETSDTCEVSMCFYDDDSQKNTYKIIEVLEIPIDGVILNNKLIRKIKLPSED